MTASRSARAPAQHPRHGPRPNALTILWGLAAAKLLLHRDLPIHLARDLKHPMDPVWPALRHYD